MKFVDIKTDYAFRKVFGDVKHKNILISFLNSILQLSQEKSILDITFLESKQVPHLEGFKESVLDINCRDHRGVEYIVEMQVLKTEAFEKRILYYTSQKYTSQLTKGEDYPKLHQVIFIGILDFIVFPQVEHYKTVHKILEEKTNLQYFHDFMFILVELPKFKKVLSSALTIEEKWYYFVKHCEHFETQPKELASIEPIKEALDLALESKWSKQELELYTKQSIYIQEERGRISIAYSEGKLEGRTEGRAEGKIEGRTESKIEIAKKMIQRKMDIQTISELSGLTEAEIKNLK